MGKGDGWRGKGGIRRNGKSFKGIAKIECKKRKEAGSVFPDRDDLTSWGNVSEISESVSVTVSEVKGVL